MEDSEYGADLINRLRDILAEREDRVRAMASIFLRNGSFLAMVGEVEEIDIDGFVVIRYDFHPSYPGRKKDTRLAVVNVASVVGFSYDDWVAGDPED